MKLLTRRQIIEEWNKQSDKMKDSKCCPACRDILDEYRDGFICMNRKCHQEYIKKSEITE
jgi:hypothetical protein